MYKSYCLMSWIYDTKITVKKKEMNIITRIRTRNIIMRYAM